MKEFCLSPLYKFFLISNKNKGKRGKKFLLAKWAIRLVRIKGMPLEFLRFSVSCHLLTRSTTFPFIFILFYYSTLQPTLNYFSSFFYFSPSLLYIHINKSCMTIYSTFSFSIVIVGKEAKIKTIGEGIFHYFYVHFNSFFLDFFTFVYFFYICFF